MLTYSFANIGTEKLYTHLYSCIRRDILSGELPAGTRLPSKRSFAENLGVSTITVENAYAQLISEGYVYALPKRGYFVARGQFAKTTTSAPAQQTNAVPQPVPADIVREPPPLFDLAGNRTDPENFPFSTWAKLMRSVISEQSAELMQNAPSGGVFLLRHAIAEHLRDFRGMQMEPENIIVGAGTEFLYGLLVQLFGLEKVWGVEDPGYRKPALIYESHGAACRYLPVDEDGVELRALEESGADILHISPAHHFPTGAVTPAARRYALLDWAAQRERYIVEDDYDSEFRLSGRPVPPLTSLDTAGRVIYMNTFTKSLASTVRISYMVLPRTLMERFTARLGFYACTVSNLEQYTLARFIGEGYFEKHLNRMRSRYRKKRDALLLRLTKSGVPGIRVSGANSGLHFLLHVKGASAAPLTEKAKAKGVRIVPLSAYYHEKPLNAEEAPAFPICYAELPDSAIETAADALLAAIMEARGAGKLTEDNGL